MANPAAGGLGAGVRCEAQRAAGPFLAELLQERGARLADLDQVPIRIADVAADLASTVLWWREELGSARAPLGVDRLDVRHADVQEAARTVRVGGCLERDRRLVLGRPAADVDDDPAVGERDERRLASQDGLAAEHLGIEAARALHVVG